MNGKPAAFLRGFRAVYLGLFFNCYGDSNAFVRRLVMETLGGFTEDYGIGREDHELLSRAVLGGFKLMVVPEALFWYRHSESRVRDQHFDRYSGDLRAFGPFMDNLPLCVHEVLRLAQGWRCP